jgi:EAL domain-containing protein (putative c-di-GMP-specific phosphodiesterase class I)
MVRGLVTLARALGLEATAEGIETESQLAMAKSEGCTEFQGYLLARPASADGLAALLLGRCTRDTTRTSSSAA